jgi:hypothetical protein
MIEEICESPKASLKKEAQKSSKIKGCVAFSKLKAWQVRQYRIAVDENKWYMAERIGQDIAWKEAELDFLQNGYYGCAPKWRNEFCVDLCKHFSSCNLGKHFCGSK